jgi:hypothetical protein
VASAQRSGAPDQPHLPGKAYARPRWLTVAQGMLRRTADYVSTAKALRRARSYWRHLSVDSGERPPLVPICMYCERVRDHEGHWAAMPPEARWLLERRVGRPELTHSVCPDCMANYLPPLD